MTLNERQKKQIERLKRLHKRGAARFILVYGMLGWGGGTALLFSIMMWLVASTPFFKTLGLSLLLFPIGGLLFGASMWWVLDHALRRVEAVEAGEQVDAARGAANQSRRLDQLAKLKQLHDSGAIGTDAYERERKALLEHGA